MTSNQEVHGRKGRVVTDEDARDITRVEELAYDLKIGDVMTPDVKFVTPDMPMSTVLDLLRQFHISGSPVLATEELVGMVSLEDLIRAMCAGDINAPILNYMSTNVLAVNSYDPVIEAMKMFEKTRVGRFPVLNADKKLVGMITKGDLTRGILIALEKDYRAEEVRRYRASHLFEDIISDRTSLIMRYNINHFDFTRGGNASSNIKRALLRLGANPQIARRCGIAVYESEINLIAHTNNGGLIRVQIEPKLIYIKVTDDGPGIPNVELAKRPGYSTATPEVREKGFGAGMGLFNINRCVDRMDLVSTVGVGTTLEMFIYLQPKESFRESANLKED